MENDTASHDFLAGLRAGRVAGDEAGICAAFAPPSASDDFAEGWELGVAAAVAQARVSSWHRALAYRR